LQDRVETSEAELQMLMVASLAGEADAYRTLLDLLRRRLVAFFSRRLRFGAAEIDDLVQETLMAIHRRRGTYDPAQPFEPWAYAIARYKLIDHFRRSGRSQAISLDDAGALFVDDESAAVDARNDIDRMLATLPERTHALIRSVKLDDLSGAEAAAQTGMTEGAVKVAIHRGLKALSALFVK
jgi:RNA polymerase sigma-70 factor (ECF subfamily)